VPTASPEEALVGHELPHAQTITNQAEMSNASGSSFLLQSSSNSIDLTGDRLIPFKPATANSFSSSAALPSTSSLPGQTVSYTNVLHSSHNASSSKRAANRTLEEQTIIRNTKARLM
jgi:hypothetical protein